VGSGARIELDLRTLMRTRATIGASTLRARLREEKAAVAAAVRTHVVPLLASGALRVPVCATYPLDDAEAAYEHFTAGGKLGKVVLVTRGP
jgi:NADPH2:quinone reductase